MSDLRFCPDGGFLVGPQFVIPEDLEEWGHGGLVERVGCNHLVCERCGAAVRQATGLLPHATRFDIEEAYAAPDLSNLPYMHAGPPETKFFRLYLCRCTMAIEGGAKAVSTERNADTPRLYWR